jgi:group I intron endonuclease
VFTSGEGCFIIILKKSSAYKTGAQVILRFQLVQHSKDEQLMRCFIEYFNCGNVYKHGDKYIYYQVETFSENIEKIIPFFNKYPIVGVKAKDFKDWCKAADLMKDKKHLTKEGLNQIQQIIAGMNTGRPLSVNLNDINKKGPELDINKQTHSEETKDLMRQKALGRKHSEETKLIMSTKRGNPVNIYEKCSGEGFKLIGSFVSARRAAKFLGISGSTIIKYINSGAIFKDRYKFSSK